MKAVALAARKDRAGHLPGLVLICMMFTAGIALAESLDDAAARYRPVVAAEVDRVLAGTRAMRDALVAEDVDVAQQEWLAARVDWERAEIVTSAFPELDRAIDAWPNAMTGFHAIEAKLFGGGRTDARAETDALLFHLGALHAEICDRGLTAQGLLDGAAKLAYEIGESKADGGESRISGASLEDMRNNVDGLDSALRDVFAAAIGAHDHNLAEALRAKIARLRDLLQVPTLSRLDANMLRAESEELIIFLQTAAPLLRLQRPSLQDLVKQ